MQMLVVLGHPDPTSFNAAIARTAAAALRKCGHEVWFHDLHAEGFPALITAPEIRGEAGLEPVIEEHCRELAHADGIVIVHPNWWGQPPAVLKGWVDRVFRPKVAYEFLEGDGGEGVPRGLLRARSALVLNTADTPAQREEEVFGDPLERTWRDCVFGLCGVEDFHRRIFRVIVTSTPEERAAWLDETAAVVESLFPPRA